MSVDILGPTNAPNTVTTRPADTRVSFGATDSWFKDCSSSLANDGTRVMAGWLNAAIAQFRTAIRGNGNTGGGAAVVAEDNSDGMLLASIQQLMQRGLTNYAVDTGTADALAVSLTPALAEYKAGTTPIRLVKSASPNASTTPTLEVNGLGPKLITRFDGTAIEAAELAGAGRYWFAFDGTNFRKVSPDRAATKDEAEAGVLGSPFISPKTLFQRRTPFFFATGSSAQSIPSGADTKVTNITSLGSSFYNSGSGVASSSFTCGAQDAGAWLFMGYSAMELLVASSGGNDYRASIAKNGSTGPFMTTYISPADTYGIVVTTPLILANGDNVDLRVFQNTGTSRNIVSTQLFGMRLSGAV